MIKYTADNESGTWGVSYCERGVIVHIGSFKNLDRITLSTEEVDHMIEKLKHFKKIFECENKK